MGRKSLSLIGAAVVLSLGIGAAHAQIFKCVDDKGKTAFQDKSCAGQGSSVTIRPAAGEPSADAVEQATKRAQGDAASLLAEGQRQRAVAAHRVIRGMGENQVREAIGAPAKKSPQPGEPVPTEVWAYVRNADGSGVTGFIILRNGTVTDVELTAYEPPRGPSREERQSADTQSKASERRFIDGKGLSESELIARIGEPDRRDLQATSCVLPSGRTYSCQQIVWIYDPTPNDAQTRTTVTIIDGRAGRVQRDVVR